MSLILSAIPIKIDVIMVSRVLDLDRSSVFSILIVRRKLIERTKLSAPTKSEW